MGAVDTLEFFTILSFLAIAADGGVVMHKCLEPQKCVPFAECRSGGPGDSDIFFNCYGSRKGGDMVCCHPPPLPPSKYNSSERPDFAPADAPSRPPAKTPVSKWVPRITSHPPTPCDGLAQAGNGVTESGNRLSAAANGSVNPNHDLEGSPKDTPVLAPSSDPRDTLDDTSSNSSNSAAPPGCCDDSVDQRIKLLPLEDCGLSTSLRITNGQNASFGQFPWMALLGYRLRDGTLSFLCGGTLINRQYVLTAAHCLEPEGATLEEVRLGEHNLDTEPDCETTENYCADPVVDVPIETAIRHEKFNSPYLKNDIALVRLQTPINSSTEYIRPICLPFGLNVTGLEEKKYQVAGWGKTDYYDSEGSAALQFTGILSMPLEDCDSRQEKEVRPLDNTQFCAGADMGRDACKGDSGGPLMETLLAPSQSTVQTFQIGIVSFGSVPCGAKYSPSVYTRVTAYLDWILDNIKP